MAADGGDAPSAATSGPRSSPCSPDEGLLTLSESEGRKLASLTPAGREHVATNAGLWPDPVHAARGDDATGPDLASLNAVLHGGGGTDLRVALAAIEEQRPRPTLAVVLTDGPAPPRLSRCCRPVGGRLGTAVPRPDNAPAPGSLLTRGWSGWLGQRALRR